MAARRTPQQQADEFMAADRMRPPASRGPEMENMTPGERAYNIDCERKPTYHDGSLRLCWSQLSRHVQDSWERNPTPREWPLRFVVSVEGLIRELGPAHYERDSLTSGKIAEFLSQTLAARWPAITWTVRER